MTALAERAASPTRATALRALAGLEARRYARHPLFLIGVAGLVCAMYLVSDNLDVTFGAGDATLVPAFFLGVLGVFVGHRLARSMARSTEALEAAPADGVMRTAALCLACLVSGAVALAWVAWMYLAMTVWPVPDSAAISSADRAAMLLAGVVYAVGGPLVGVMVGRWTRLPGAALLAVAVLYGWTVLAMSGLAMPASRIATLVHLNAPFTFWVSPEGTGHEDPWVAAGSPGWHLAYITLLCGLAASAAMLPEALGPRRLRMVRVLVILAVLTLASLGLAAAPDPTRIPL